HPGLGRVADLRGRVPGGGRRPPREGAGRVRRRRRQGMDRSRGEPREGRSQAGPRGRSGRRRVNAHATAASQVLKSDTVRFAHASERQFARLLDFYQIEWEYEPTSFDLEWDRQGSVTQRFTPDFYLPQYDLYPGVNCKIFYQRDYLSLVRKYGLEDLTD